MPDTDRFCIAASPESRLAMPLQYRKLRAPRANRQSLADPPLEAAGAVLRGNTDLRGHRAYDFQGKSLAELTRQARSELLCQARRWTAAYRDLNSLPCDASAPVLLAGHQPQLFHPGVWFKNFALGELARRLGAVPINLIIDSDTIKSASLRVPGGTSEQPHVTSLPIDAAGPPLPYEERRVLNRCLLAGFGDRVIRQMGPLVSEPLVRRFWPMVRQRVRQCDNLGACLATARHQLEGEWGLHTLEVPQSRACDGEAFSWLVAHILAHLPRFWEIHNATIQQYRRLNRIRSAAHPVPDLAADGAWLESPFWVWTADDPQRRPLMARRRGDEVILSNAAGREWTLPLDADRPADRAVDRLREFSALGVKIRSRALTTTLWARLVLGDLFIHGIGGAKYDQVTDALIERFFGLPAPAFLTLSATLCLPVDTPLPKQLDTGAIRQQLRDLEFHPERHVVAADAEVADLLAEKRRWVATPQTRANARERFLAIRRVNEALQPRVADCRERLVREWNQRAGADQAAAILQWREYSFCLYPEDELREFLFGLL